MQLTFGEVAEAVGTLRRFPLRGGRRGLRIKKKLLQDIILHLDSAFSIEKFGGRGNNVYFCGENIKN